MVNKIKKAAILVLFSGVFFEMYGQSMYKNKSDGMAILDLTDMPVGAITDVPKYTGTYIGDNKNYLVDKIFAIDENKRMFQKLEIAPGDLNASGTAFVSSGTGTTMTWDKAFNGCRDMPVSSNENTWRLPTQRELQLMWIFKEAIDDIYINTSFYNSYYWSATEADFIATRAWVVDFENGFTNNHLKNNSDTTYRWRTRCVREIE